VADLIPDLDFEAYAAEIRQKEDSNIYNHKNEYGYMGAYQMRKLALQDAGFQDINGNWTALAQSLGVHSDDTFLSNHTVQDIAFIRYTERNYGALHSFGTLKYVGKIANGTKITFSGLLAGAHLVGAMTLTDYLKQYFANEGPSLPADANHTTAADYLSLFRDPGGWLKAYPRTFNVTKNLTDFAKSLNSPLDDLAKNMGQTGVSVAPKSPKAQAENSTPTPRAQGGAGVTVPASRVAAPPSVSSILKPTRPAGHGLNVVAPSTPFYEETGASFDGRAPVHPLSAEMLPAGLDGGMASIPHEQLRAMGSQNYMPPSGSGIGSIAPVGLVAGSRAAMPSQLSVSQHVDDGKFEARKGGSKTVLGNIVSDVEHGVRHVSDFVETELSDFEHALDNYFSRQARLPPSGVTSFDPRLTPAWAGVKLPV
jgi:hypothetical protein